MTMRPAVRPWHLSARALYLPTALCLAATHSPAQSNKFWQAPSIYQIITDRFYDGDTNNDNAEGTYFQFTAGAAEIL